jgi:hypothetical protein
MRPPKSSDEMKISHLADWIKKIPSVPEINFFVFAFLVNFVYEVWQSPYFEFYNQPSLAEKIAAINHCTFGDGVITVICSLIVSWLYRSRYWILQASWKSILIFTGLGWAYTFVSEIYRTRIAHLYGVFNFTLPIIGISWLPLLQWAILPPIVIYLTRRQILGELNRR